VQVGQYVNPIERFVLRVPPCYLYLFPKASVNIISLRLKVTVEILILSPQWMLRFSRDVIAAELSTDGRSVREDIQNIRWKIFIPVSRKLSHWIMPEPWGKEAEIHCFVDADHTSDGVMQNLILVFLSFAIMPWLYGIPRSRTLLKHLHKFIVM
jgi:hypothetical protein